MTALRRKKTKERHEAYHKSIILQSAPSWSLKCVFIDEWALVANSHSLHLKLKVRSRWWEFEVDESNRLISICRVVAWLLMQLRLCFGAQFTYWKWILPIRSGIRWILPRCRSCIGARGWSSRDWASSTCCSEMKINFLWRLFYLKLWEARSNSVGMCLPWRVPACEVCYWSE